MHKDKFVAPIIHDEMETMEVKKSGKVEHSDNAHDDQVFSYLMALYVWYDGNDLAERFDIQKNTLKTDEDIEIEDTEMEKSEGGLVPVDIEVMSREEDDATDELAEQMEYIQQAQQATLYHEFDSMQTAQDQECLNRLLSDPATKQLYAKQMHIDLTEPALGGVMAGSGTGMTQLPDDIFGETDFGDDDYFDDYYNPMQQQDNLAGNLAGAWRSLGE